MFKAWFKTAYEKLRGKIKAKIKQKVGELPPLSELIKYRKVFASALLTLGDATSAWEPEELARLEYVTELMDAAEFAADVTELIPGLDKLDDVRDGVKLAFKGFSKLDQTFDEFWTKIRPFINSYVTNARAVGYYPSKPGKAVRLEPPK